MINAERRPAGVERPISLHKRRNSLSEFWRIARGRGWEGGRRAIARTLLPVFWPQRAPASFPADTVLAYRRTRLAPRDVYDSTIAARGCCTPGLQCVVWKPSHQPSRL